MMIIRSARRMAVCSAVILLLFAPVNIAAQTIRLKIATLAPEGSPWMDTFNAVNDELREKTDNRIRLKIYSGGVLGDEKDMLRKMVIGQIHGVVLTSSGLSTIFPEIKVFQIPFLFQTHEETDYVLNKMDAFFRKGFNKKGFQILGWSEAGFVFLLSNSPADTLAKIKKMKVWIWEDAPMAKAIFDEAGVSAIPLSVPDVLMGLQTGLVDVVYAPPTGAIALQWFTKTKYMADVPLIYMMGAIVVNKKLLKNISPEQWKLLEEIFQRHTNQLKGVLRKQNQEAVQVMAEHGVKILKVSEEQIEQFKKLSVKAIENIRGSSFSPKTRDELKAHLETYRRSEKK